jgi:hypothetical protein
VGCCEHDNKLVLHWRISVFHFIVVIMNLRFPYKAGNFMTNCETVRFSGNILLHGVSERQEIYG